MKWYYQVFWFMFIIEVCVTPFLVLQWMITGSDVVGYYKIPLLISFAVICYYHLVSHIKWKPINILFLLGGTISLAIGAYQNAGHIDSKYLSAFYTILMPIFSISFGVAFAKVYNIRIKYFVIKIMNIAFVITIVVLIIYMILYNRGIIRYNNFGTGMAFIGSHAITQGSIFQYMICLIFAILSGKRATAVMTLLVFFVYYSRIFSKFSIRDFLVIIPLSLILITGIYYAYQNDKLSRFDAVFKFDINDRRSTYVATSGRWQEVEGIIEYMQTNPYQWFTGAGIGSTYTYNDIANNMTWKKHFAHFTPMGYVFLYGIPFTIMLYIFLIGLMIKGLNKSKNFYFVAFVIMILGSTFGANMFVDHKIWVFVGIVYVLTSDKKNRLPISYLHLR